MPTPEELEARAAREASAGLRKRLEELTARSLAMYDLLEPGPARDTMRRLIAAQVEKVSTDDVPGPIQDAITKALELGAADAARRARVATPPVRQSVDVTLAALNAPDKAAEELAKAASRVLEADDPESLRAALSTARRAVTRVEAAAKFAVNTSLSEGTRAVTEAHGLSRIWLPERDACVHCLAYAGEVAGPGESFRGGLTFGSRPLVPASEDVPDAPLHPNCRCRVQVYKAEWSPDQPDALKREALRSVLRGWSLPSESDKVRLDAAERALRHATRMPKTVQDYARSAVRRGAFARGRAFPRTDRHEVKARKPDTLPDVKPAPRLAPNGLSSLPRRTMPDPGSVDESVRINREQRDQITRTNPRFGEPGYGINCVHVVAAAELRRRGYDVEATPLPTELWGNNGRNMGEALARWRTAPTADRWVDRLSGQPVDSSHPRAYLVPGNPEGETRTVTVVPGYPTVAKLVMTMDSLAPPGPARFWIVLGWKTGGAHVFSAEVLPDGNLAFYDAQNGKRVKIAGYMARANKANVVRVDDLVPTDAVMEFVRPRQQPQTVNRQMTPEERLRQVEGDW